MAQRWATGRTRPTRDTDQGAERAKPRIGRRYAARPAADRRDMENG
ncbi:hypothetical protein KPATCC21470_7552 [Kitasatospora purpeofusca]